MRTSTLLVVTALSAPHVAAYSIAPAFSPRALAACAPVARRAVAAASSVRMSADDEIEQDPNAFQVTLVNPDEEGKSIECTMMETAEVSGKLYASMVPRDRPALIAVLDADEGVLAEVDDPDELAALLPAARKVCESLGLDLLDTALTLTLAGDVVAAEEAYEDQDVRPTCLFFCICNSNVYSYC